MRVNVRVQRSVDVSARSERAHYVKGMDAESAVGEDDAQRSERFKSMGKNSSPEPDFRDWFPVRQCAELYLCCMLTCAAYVHSASIARKADIHTFLQTTHMSSPPPMSS